MWNCKEQQCTVKRKHYCVSVGLEACAVMQSCPIVSQKMTLCPIWLCLPNFFLPRLWCLSPITPSRFLFPRHSQGDFPSFPAAAAFPSFVLGGFSADKRWEQGRLTESREGEAREEALWKWEETDEIIKQETGMDAFSQWGFANTRTSHNRKQLRWHQEMEMLAQPHCFFKQNRWLTQLSHQSGNRWAFTTVSTNSARIWDEVSKFRDQRNWECKKRMWKWRLETERQI